MHTGLKKRLAARRVPPILNRHIERHPVLVDGLPMDVPLGGAWKIFLVGRQPIQLAVDGYSNAVRPQAEHDAWALQVT